MINTIKRLAARLFGVNPPRKNTALYCPNRSNIAFAHEGTPPIDYNEQTGVATYSCSVCLEHHQFRWGPPAPVHVGDNDEDAVPVTLGTLVELVYQSTEHGNPDDKAVNEANSLIQDQISDSNVPISTNAESSMEHD